MHAAASIPHHLFAEAEIRAEATVAKLRAVVAAVLLAGVVVVILRPALAEPDPALMPSVLTALGSSGAFLLHGGLTLTVVRSGRFRRWMGWVFATVDVALVTGSVWLGLAVTDLAGGWLIAIPSLWVAPLILGFGALRYNPWIQAWVTILLVGALAVLAALAGPGPVPAGGPPPAMLAEPAPNVMRLIMLALAGGVLVVAAWRARVLLSRAFDEVRRRHNLTRFLPPQLAGRLAEQGLAEITRGTRRTAAVMFVDIRGFTRRAEAMEPEAVSVFLGEFRRRVTACADGHHGVVDKFIGDAALIVFGAPIPSAAAAADALACARALLAEADGWSEALVAEGRAPVAIGIGLHHGEVFCGAVGTAERLEFTVLGDVVNVAARLQDECKRTGLSLVASRELLEAAGEAPVGWVAMAPHPVRGRDGNLTLFGQRPYAAAS